MPLVQSDWNVGAMFVNLGFLVSVVGLLVVGIEAIRWRRFTLRRVFAAITFAAVLMAIFQRR